MGAAPGVVFLERRMRRNAIAMLSASLENAVA